MEKPTEMTFKEFKSCTRGVKRQYEYQLKKLKEKHNVRDYSELINVIKEYYEIKGSISALSECLEFLNDKAYKFVDKEK